MKVRILQSMAGIHHSWHAGDVADVPSDQAKRMIAAGVADAAPADAKVTAMPTNPANATPDPAAVSEPGGNDGAVTAIARDESPVSVLAEHGVAAKPLAALEADGIATIAQLQARIEQGTLTEVDGIGEATATKIADALAAYLGLND